MSQAYLEMTHDSVDTTGLKHIKNILCHIEGSYLSS
jgi:hypothetical protein